MSTNLFAFIFITTSLGFASASPRVYDITPRKGSLNGGTLVEVNGAGFSPDQFSQGEGNENKGNLVYFKSDTVQVACDVVEYLTTTSTISCYTRAAIAGRYTVQVEVDGVYVDAYCNSASACRFEYLDSSTPKITGVYPRAGTSDSVINIAGYIVSDIVTESQTQDESYEDSNTDIQLKRVYMGPSICNLINATGYVYGINKASNGWGDFNCKPNSTVVDSKNITYVVTNQYGLSYMYKDALTVSFLRDIYLFQLYADVQSVSPSTGSVEGGTLITIEGHSFGENVERVGVKIGGVDCEIVSVTKTAIQCRTGAQPTSQPSYPGNRGMIREVWTDTYVSSDFSDAEWDTSASDYNFEIVDEFSSPEEPSFGEADSYSSRFRGYFVAPYDGEFRFLISSDDQSELFFSPTENPDDKAKLAFVPGYTNVGQYDKYPTDQQSDLQTLVAGNRYYMEAIHTEGGGGDFLRVGLRMYALSYSHSQLGSASDERQVIEITSPIADEKQLISFSDNSSINFVLTFAGVDSTALTSSSSADNVRDALYDMVSVDCERDGPVGDYFIDYEDEPSSSNYINGNRVKDVEPFCGHWSLKNPGYIFYMGKTETDSGNKIDPFNTQTSGQICFAYKGAISHTVMFRINWYENNGNERSNNRYYTIDGLSRTSSWTHFCFNVHEYISADSWIGQNSKEGKPWKIERIRLYREDNTDDDFYIDNFSYGGYEVEYQPSSSSLRPNDILITDVAVEKSDGGDFTITLSAADCGYNYPLMGIKDATIEEGSTEADSVTFSDSSWSANATITVERVQSASPPVTGTFRVTWKGNQTNNLNADIDESHMKSALEKVFNVGKLNVERTGTCSGYSWSVEWLELGADQPEINELDATNLNGNSVQLSVTTEIDGAVTLSPIPGDYLRVPYGTPQVEVTVNGIISNCSGDCGYVYDNAQTATITGVDTHTGSEYDSTSITITGSGFSTDADNNVVTINNVVCSITSATSSELVCNVGQGAAGDYEVKVNVSPGGYASSGEADVGFTYESEYLTVSPTSGSAAGGTTVTVTGYGFSSDLVNTAIDLGDGIDCIVTAAVYDEIICTTTNQQERRKRRRRSNDLDQFIADSTGVPTITSLDPTSSHVSGGGVLTIVGTDFGNDTDVVSVTIDGNDCAITSHVGTGIECDIPAANAPGVYVVTVNKVPEGNSESQLTLTYDLEVTGVFPDQGSFLGGTRVFVTGTGFGTDPTVTDVLFGDTACDVVSVQDDQIECTSGTLSRHHTVTNQGIHEDYGIGYKWSQTDFDVTVGDVVEWQWITPEHLDNVGYTIQQTADEDSVDYNGQGFYAGPSSPIGSYSYIFTEEGTYYYSSGPVLSTASEDDQIYLKGIVTVESYNPTAGTVTVLINDVPADHNVSQEVSAPDGGACPGDGSTCTDDSPNCPSESEFCFKYMLCSTAEIHKIEPLSGPADSTITITGSGFANANCRNVVYVGTHVCDVQAASQTSIECTINTENSPEVGYLQEVSVNVKNLGLALNTIQTPSNRSFLIVPSVTSVSPVTGSLAGGTLLTIVGNGFSDNADELSVTIDGRTCIIDSSTYQQIECYTTAAESNDGVTSPIKVTNNNQESAEEDVVFTYSASVTPTVTDISPGSIAGPNNEVTLSGTGFGSDSSVVEVTICGIACSVDEISGTEITCSIDAVPWGTCQVNVHLEGSGLATFENGHTIWADKVVSAVSPGLGSRLGGTEVTITGSGFYVDSTSVKFDNKDCVVTDVTVSTITCTTENHGAGLVDVTVTSNEVEFAVLVDGYEYSNDATPDVTDISPTSGQADDVITITGSLFGNDTAGVHVEIGGVECAINSVSETEIECAAQDHSAGTYDVVVRVAALGIASGDVQFQYNLAITAVSPDDGSFAGQKNLTITGSGFSADTMVTVCNNTCTVTSVTSSTIDCLVPTNENIAASLVCDIVVTISDELTVTETDGFTYRESLTAIIDSVTPARGGTGGGTAITIAGSGFKATGNTVTIAGSDCVVDSESESEIVCTTEAHSGSVKTNVRVVLDADDNIATQDNAEFYYVDVWSSQWTWGGQEPPREGEFVIIPAGQTLLLDETTEVLKFLLIEGGSLIFDEVDITLNAENILIMDGGLLQVGTEEEPFQHKGTIMMHGHQRSLEMPLYGAKTLAVRNGTLDLHGIPIPVTWTYLAETAEVGATELVLEKGVTWNVDDQIVVASTGDRHSQRENEMVTITAKSADGTTLTIEPALKYEHISEEQMFDDVLLSTKAEVGVLTRNVVVRGSVQEEWTEDIEACDDEFDPNQFATQTCFQGRFGEEIGSDQFGSQIMLFGKYQNQQLVTGRIEYVEVTHAGQAFRLGRYPIHFHLNGDVNGSYVRGCGIHHTFNRAVTIHAVDNLLVEHNVAFDIMGHAYFMEDGIEVGNVIQYNLGVFVKSSSSLLNVDITPATFWVTNPSNTVRHNAAAGGSHFGFWYNLPNHPMGPSFTTSMCPRKMLMGEFTNNTAHSQGWYGLWIFPEYHPMEGGECGSTVPTPAVFDGLTTWNVERGAEAITVGAVQFHNFLIADADQAGFEYQTIDSDSPFDDTGALIKNSVVIGYSDLTASKKNTSCTKAGIHCPKSKGLTIDGVRFFNFDQKCCAAFRSCAHCKPDQGGFQARTKNLEFNNSPNKALFTWIHEHWYEDLDGTLTGGVGHIALPYNGNLPPDHCSQDDAFGLGVTGATCDETIKLHRMAFNGAEPESLKYKDAVFVNEYGNSSVPYHLKRITHPEGWMVTLIEGETYNFFFEYADHVTNISYNARFDGFNDGDFVIVGHEIMQTPDHVEITDVTTENSEAALTYADNDNGDWRLDTENDNNDLSYLISGKGIDAVEGENLQVHLRVYRCYYTNCIAPIPGAPVEGRPEVYDLWSEVDTWNDVEEGWGWNTVDGNSVALPVEGDDVMIAQDTFVVADVELPALGKLYIYGGLEIEGSTTITATYILVTGGLFIGSVDTPFPGQFSMILQGSHATPDVPIQNGPNMGSKVLGVFGRLEMHGAAPNVPWTKLSATANAGSDTITLVDDVDWIVGNEIVLTATSYEAWETETFKIVEVVDAQTLRINGTLQFTHIAQTVTLDDDTTYTEAAEVGLLTRNIKIIGADYDDLYDESFGARVLIGKFNSDGTEYTGFARISNVEFYHSGQEGWTDYYDPRYSVAFVDTGEVTIENPSYVRSCSFHNGFSPAIGVFGASGVLIENNVIHHTVGAGIIVWGSNNRITGNLVSLTVFPGTYRERFLKEDKTWPAGIEIQLSFGTVLANNTVAGSERLLYRVSGEKCAEATVWENNEGHTALAGLMMLPPDGQRQCTRINDFFLWKNYYYGIYLENTCSLIVSNVILADNKIGILPYIYRPPSLSHETSEKTFTIENSLIIGKSPSFDCDEWESAPENEIQCAPVHSPPQPPNGGRVGFMMTNFMSGSNNAPIKAFHGIKNYPAISGHTMMKNVKFAHFDEGCASGSRDYCIAPNPGNQDGVHPTTAQGTTFDSVHEDSKVLFFFPNVGDANPADCVDMTCDAMRKVFIKDDGGILGTPGTVLPNSAYQWDGDQRYGLGDYRIPKMLVTDTDGNRLAYEDKCPNKGIFGTQSSDCEWKEEWNAFKCNDNLEYVMMIIESMDPDTELRRLSPIALYTDGYVDLINGPQDHGWCHGYTCQERISTFMTVVATAKTYEVYMSSTNPQTTRLHLLNANENHKVVVGIWYANPQRLDVYHQGRYVIPNNGRIDSDGALIWIDDTETDFKPQPDSTLYGGNYFDRDLQTLWVLLRGNTPIDIITTPVIMVALGVPAVSVDDFFEVNLRQNLANLLGIQESQIRIVDIVREGSTSRRRRATNGEAVVEMEISDQPSTTIELEGNYTTDGNVTASHGNYTEGNSSLGYDELLALQSIIVDAAQTGTLSESLEVEVGSLAMTDPVEPATDPTGGVRATNETAGEEDGDTLYGGGEEEEEELTVEVVYQFPSALSVSQAPSGVNEDWPFIVTVAVLDTQGEIVMNLGHSSNPWKMLVSLGDGTGPDGAQLLGNTTVSVINGVADFTDIKLDLAGSSYVLNFDVVYPNTSTLAPISTEAFSVAEREFEAVVSSQPNVSVRVGQMFDVGFDMVDVLSGLQLTDLESYGYNWSASIEIYEPDNYFGSLIGNKTTDVDPTLATGLFTGLEIDVAGFQYILEITVAPTTSSAPSSYTITQQLVSFDVVPASSVVHTGEPMLVSLRFFADYNTVAANNELNVQINFLNKFSSVYVNVTFEVVRIYEGSIIIDFTMVGDVDNTAATMYSDLQAGRITLFIDGMIIEADQDYMQVDGELYGPSDADEESGVPVWAIVLVVLILLLLVIIIVIAIYKLCYNPNNKLAAVETMHLTEREEAPRTSSRNELDRGTPIFRIQTPDNQCADECKPLTDDTSRPSSRNKSPGFNHPSRTPEVVATALPPGFAEGSEEHLKEDRATMFIMQLAPDKSFVKLGQMAVNLVGTLSDLRRELKVMLAGSKKDEPFVLLTETLKDIDGAGEKRQVVQEVYASDSVLFRFLEEKDIDKLCVCGVVGQFECSLCHTQIYCSPQCQSSDWAKHIQTCNGGETANYQSPDSGQLYNEKVQEDAPPVSYP